MNREEARLELDATTLRPQDASPEARAFAQKDTALGTWIAERRAFDERAADALAAAPIPAGLRESLLRASARPAKKFPGWLATSLAAAAACFALGWHFLWPSHDLPAWQAESLAAVTQVEYGMSRLDQQAGELDLVKKFLVSAGDPSPQRLPVAISGMPTYGCKRIRVGNRPATIICFQMKGGKEAHLVVLENTGLEEIPPQMEPQFATSKNWNLASWSDGHQSYLLATTADAAALKKLFGLT